MEPSSPLAGDMWFNPEDQKSYYFDGTKWVDITPKDPRAFSGPDDPLLDYFK